MPEHWSGVKNNLLDVIKAIIELRAIQERLAKLEPPDGAKEATARHQALYEKVNAPARPLVNKLQRIRALYHNPAFPKPRCLACIMGGKDSCTHYPDAESDQPLEKAGQNWASFPFWLLDKDARLVGGYHDRGEAETAAQKAPGHAVAVNRQYRAPAAGVPAQKKPQTPSIPKVAPKERPQVSQELSELLGWGSAPPPPDPTLHDLANPREPRWEPESIQGWDTEPGRVANPTALLPKAPALGELLNGRAPSRFTALGVKSPSENDFKRMEPLLVGLRLALQLHELRKAAGKQTVHFTGDTRMESAGAWSCGRRKGAGAGSDKREEVTCNKCRASFAFGRGDVETGEGANRYRAYPPVEPDIFKRRGWKRPIGS